MISVIKKNPLPSALLASLFLHLAGLLSSGVILNSFQSTKSPEDEPTSLVLTFDDNQMLPKQTVETPESAKENTPIPDTPFASDKNFIAKNPEAPNDLPNGESYSDGLFPHAETNPENFTIESIEKELTNDFNKREELQAASLNESPYHGTSYFKKEYLVKQKPVSPITVQQKKSIKRKKQKFAFSDIRRSFVEYLRMEFCTLYDLA